STDLAAVGLYFTKAAVTRPLGEVGMFGTDSIIPFAAEPIPRKPSFFVQSDSQPAAVRPRVHPRRVSFQATAYRPDGTQDVLIWTRGYQFDWQPTYYFKQPVPLPKGTRIEVIVYFDNSEENRHNPNNPPKAVRWSELATDHWCVFLLAPGA